MSENNQTPKLKAGEAIIDVCPLCKAQFNELVETNSNVTCPNLICGKTFCIMVFE